MAKYAFGVDIGGTTVKMGLFDTEGQLLDAWEIRTRTEEGGQYILDDIAVSMEKALKEKGIAKDDVVGAGLGVPGPVGADGTVFRCVNLGWDVMNVEKAMSEKCGWMVKAGNDANVAALGEMWMGGGKGFRNIVMVTLGTGVGGGVITDGRILPGVHGAAGEIGHIPVRDGEPLACGCGKHGCLEQYASATGIARLAREYLQEHEEASILREVSDLTAKDVFDAAKKGDAVALEQVEQFGRTLGKALASISCVADPEAFVIGGGVAKAGQILLDVVQKYYRQYAFHASRDAEFKAASLGNSAGIYGGVKMVLPPQDFNCE